MRPKRLCVVTGGRAEYGLLSPLLQALHGHPAFELQLAVTGMHLDPRFGLTVDAIGFPIAARIPIHEDADDAPAIARSMGRGVAGFGRAIADLQPDLMLVLGDRFEILAAVAAALPARLPVAHIAGGDVTKGAWDDAIRDAISQMATLHFATNRRSGERLRRMGRTGVHVVGHTGLDAVRDVQRMDRAELQEFLGWELRPRNILITYHPETLDQAPPTRRFAELLQALEGRDEGLIFTMPNADSGGLALWQQVERWIDGRPHAIARKSLGQRGYLSALGQVDVVLGNSSSGLYEAPSFGIPTIDVGDRQEGRIRAASVLHVPPTAAAIRAALDRAPTLDCSAVRNPYDLGGATERIVAILQEAM